MPWSLGARGLLKVTFHPGAAGKMNRWSPVSVLLESCIPDPGPKQRVVVAVTQQSGLAVSKSVAIDWVPVTLF